MAHIATFAILHDDKDLGRLLVDHAIEIPHDVRMTQFAEDIDLHTSQSGNAREVSRRKKLVTQVFFRTVIVQYDRYRVSVLRGRVMNVRNIHRYERSERCNKRSVRVS